MFKIPDGIDGKPKREILIPSKGSAFTPYNLFVQSSNTPPRKKARLGERASPSQSCDATLDVRSPSCAVT